MLLAGNDVQDGLIGTVSSSAAGIFGVRIVVTRPGSAKDLLFGLPICLDILQICLVKAIPDSKIQVKKHLGIPDDRIVHLHPELREGIARLNGTAGFIVDHVQAVLQQLPVTVCAGILQPAVILHKSPDPVKIHVQLFCGQIKILLQGRISLGKGRFILRPWIIESVAFRVQNAAGPSCFGDLSVQDFLLFGEAGIIRQDLNEKCCACFCVFFTPLTAPLEHIQPCKAHLLPVCRRK